MNHHSQIEDIAIAPQTNASSDDIFPMIASIENQLTLQIWKPKDDFFESETEQLAFVEKINESELE